MYGHTDLTLPRCARPVRFSCSGISPCTFHDSPPIEHKYSRVADCFRRVHRALPMSHTTDLGCRNVAACPIDIILVQC